MRQNENEVRPIIDENGTRLPDDIDDTEQCCKCKKRFRKNNMYINNNNKRFCEFCIVERGG